MRVFREMGTFYGYPTCCIDWFINERFAKLIPLTEAQEKAVDNRGYVPCPECAKKVNKDFPLTKLIVNRICSNPYPIGNDVQLEEYLEKEHNLIRTN